MTRKQIEAARERRLWLTQIVVPVTSTAVAALSIPEVRQTIAAKALHVKAEAQEKISQKVRERASWKHGVLSFAFANFAGPYMEIDSL